MANVRVKICGITREEDLAAAIDAGADAIGFNFFPGSPRYLNPEAAARLVPMMTPFVDGVGLFVNESIAAMRQAIARLGLRTMQWVGGEPEVQNPGPQQLITSFRIREAQDLAKVSSFVIECRAAGFEPGAVLIDAFSDGVFGGSGEKVNWEWLTSFDPQARWVLAGGLTPDNVAQAVIQARPWAVDVASGVESRPGVKDHDAMRRFIDRVKSA